MSIGVKKTIIEVEYRDLEKFIKKVYDKNIELVPSENWSNDESHSFNVDGQLDTWEETELMDFMENDDASYGITRVLLNDLARKGEIEVGEYIVNVCW